MNAFALGARTHTHIYTHTDTHTPLAKHALTEKLALKLMPHHKGNVGRKVL